MPETTFFSQLSAQLSIIGWTRLKAIVQLQGHTFSTITATDSQPPKEKTLERSLSVKFNYFGGGGEMVNENQGHFLAHKNIQLASSKTTGRFTNKTKQVTKPF